MESGNSAAGGGGSGSTPPFLIKTYDMVEDASTDHVVSWGPGGASFVVWNPLDFSRDLLPKYFKHNNFSSFIRQLNTYGFRKIDPERWEFANEDFMRGHTHLLKNIHRRKPVHSHSVQNQINGSLAESERRELEDEINRLKYEKSVLLADAQRHTQQQYVISWQMQTLEGRLTSMEQRQKNIISSLREIFQRRGVDSSSLLEADHFSKKRRVPKIDFFVDVPAALEEEQKVFQLQGMGIETPATSPVNSEAFDRMELALVSLEKLVQRANYASADAAECMYHGASIEPSPATTPGEMNTAPVILHPSSPNTVTESPSFVQSPVLAMAEVLGDSPRGTAKVVDMDSEVASSEDGTTETEASHEPATVNDVFWERFLTETPQSCSGESERKERHGEKDDQITHHREKVDQIIEQMGHLASAENT
ncbi:hypothetical protein GUJ93_ZPchr0286g2795 [Zizania palustris]|uniref:HSF-type DNA-binding domain-containing protein n=1 Tax=Zizania palustris TaxID=103762 RepID=A0A8J5VUI8_ZIZPA|nr:hypothetical protein GUJ93_ZPchr0286g2795 [Zizania palustris]